MKTYEQGRAPAWAPVTWCGNDAKGRDAAIYGATEPPIIVARQHADAICRAFHVAKLAVNYAKAKAALDAAATADDIESVRAAYYDAARALCEAVR